MWLSLCAASYLYKNSKNQLETLFSESANLKSPLATEQEVSRFTFWSDSNLISTIYANTQEPFIKSRIEKYQKRQLHKRLSQFPLSDYPSIDKKAIQAIKYKLMQKSFSASPDFSFVIIHPVAPPVFEKEVQKEIKVVEGNTEYTLAEFLDLKKPSDIDFVPVKSGPTLQVFGSRIDKISIDSLIDQVMNDYRDL